MAEWLRTIGCQKYDTVFESELNLVFNSYVPHGKLADLLENNITGETLLECDQSVLKELGITKVGDRVRIFVAVKALRARVFGNGKKRNRVCFTCAILGEQNLTTQPTSGYFSCARQRRPSSVISNPASPRFTPKQTVLAAIF